ncbi:MAG: helix-turn-helix domain-containing protein [Cellvibrio sp.]
MLMLLSQWMIGFSFVSLVLFWLVYWSVFRAFEKTWLSKMACTSMLIALALLQWHHWQWIALGESIFNNAAYLAILFLAAPSFYLFSRELLQFNTRNHPLLLLHFIPLIISPWLSGVIGIPIAFSIGCGYALWLCLIIFKLRGQRQYFSLEFVTFAAFAAIALFILLIGLLAPWVGEFWFVIAYSNLIGLALLAMLYLQLRFPDITQKTCDAVAASYAASTLKNADCDALIGQLKRLLLEQKIYRDENLNLSTLADNLALSSHQTSELINTHFGQSFSRLIREHRVHEAKQQLVNEPKASVLSIGLAVGFSTQSNFYSAFRELTGETPGQFRKRMGIADT